MAATVAGNALEFYDFVTYAFFAVYIGRPSSRPPPPLGSLLLSVAVFGVGFVSRPLGHPDRTLRRPRGTEARNAPDDRTDHGGDRRAGVTHLPSRIGIVAPLVVVAARLVQGTRAGRGGAWPPRF